MNQIVYHNSLYVVFVLTLLCFVGNSVVRPLSDAVYSVDDGGEIDESPSDDSDNKDDAKIPFFAFPPIYLAKNLRTQYVFFGRKRVLPHWHTDIHVPPPQWR